MRVFANRSGPPPKVLISAGRPRTRSRRLPIHPVPTASTRPPSSRVRTNIPSTREAAPRAGPPGVPLPRRTRQERAVGSSPPLASETLGRLQKSVEALEGDGVASRPARGIPPSADRNRDCRSQLGLACREVDVNANGLLVRLTRALFCSFTPGTKAFGRRPGECGVRRAERRPRVWVQQGANAAARWGDEGSSSSRPPRRCVRSPALRHRGSC